MALPGLPPRGTNVRLLGRSADRPLPRTSMGATQRSARRKRSTKASSASLGVRPAKGNQERDAHHVAEVGGFRPVAVLTGLPSLEKLFAAKAEQPPRLALEQLAALVGSKNTLGSGRLNRAQGHPCPILSNTNAAYHLSRFKFPDWFSLVTLDDPVPGLRGSSPQHRTN